MSIEGVFRNSYEIAARCLDEFMNDAPTQANLVVLAERLAGCFDSGGKVLVAGNGGSLADAMHFAEEWTGRFRKDRRALPALVVCDPTHVTCGANDDGADYIFSRMVDAFAKPEDMVFLLSTSGNSQNLVLAAESAKAKGATVVGFLGRGGGKLAPLCDIVVMAPGETSDRIQEIHMMTLHILIEAVEIRLGLAEAW
ncbi:D-sedoheptulose 7-phosphate isomerase [soil metagenome]